MLRRDVTPTAEPSYYRYLVLFPLYVTAPGGPIGRNIVLGLAVAMLLGLAFYYV